MDAAITIRPYEPADAAPTLAVFLAAVTETAAADYSPEQIRAWARADDRDLESWHAASARRGAFVAEIAGAEISGAEIAGAEIAGAVVGFSDVSATGYVDMMFVSPRFLRRGVASRLLEHAEATARHAGTRELTSDVSITARPFFERCGFEVVAEQQPAHAGVALTNFRMRKRLT